MVAPLAPRPVDLRSGGAEERAPGAAEWRYSGDKRRPWTHAVPWASPSRTLGLAGRRRRWAPRRPDLPFPAIQALHPRRLGTVNRRALEARRPNNPRHLQVLRHLGMKILRQHLKKKKIDILARGYSPKGGYKCKIRDRFAKRSQ